MLIFLALSAATTPSITNFGHGMFMGLHGGMGHSKIKIKADIDNTKGAGDTVKKSIDKVKETVDKLIEKVTIEFADQNPSALAKKAIEKEGISYEQDTIAISLVNEDKAKLMATIGNFISAMATPPEKLIIVVSSKDNLPGFAQKITKTFTSAEDVKKFIKEKIATLEEAVNQVVDKGAHFTATTGLVGMQTGYGFRHPRLGNLGFASLLETNYFFGGKFKLTDTSLTTPFKAYPRLSMNTLFQARYYIGEKAYLGIEGGLNIQEYKVSAGDVAGHTLPEFSVPIFSAIVGATFGCAINNNFVAHTSIRGTIPRTYTLDLSPVKVVATTSMIQGLVGISYYFKV